MYLRYKETTVLLAFTAMTSSLSAESTPEKPQTRTAQKPNVVLFMLDDAGFGHLGAYGGSIDTPNIDRVAKMGLRYTNFHTTALCSPTRAALLTGRNHHSVGAGVIVELQTDYPGYSSRIPKEKFPLVETLRQSGYATAAFGKWHNTPVDEVSKDGPFDLWPTGLGFERFYGFNAGDTSQWEPLVWDNTKPITPHAGRSDYHFTTDMTDKAIEWLNGENTKDPEKPFFLYYATGAVHAPHHAPASYIEKYKGRFNKGWDKERDEILARQIKMGLVPEGTTLAPRPEAIAAWDTLSRDEKLLYARFEEAFAGFLDHTDEQFGRLLAALEKSGKMDNTIIIVTSDNGASGEGGLQGSINEGLYFNGLPEDFASNLKRMGEIGSKSSYNHYPAGWALAGNTPLALFKQTTNEGGVRDPFIIAWPDKIKEQGGIRHQFTHVIDVLPTLMDVAAIEPMDEVNGIKQDPIEGESFAQSLTKADAKNSRKAQYFEMLGNRAIWQDGWKAVSFHGRLPWDTQYSDKNFDDDPWKLYKIDSDPSESTDVGPLFPQKLAELKALFHEKALQFNVYPLDDSTTGRLLATISSFTKGVSEFTYSQGDGSIHSALAPPLKNRSHEISAEMTISDSGADGVIVADGGRVGGYSFFVKDGYLHYVHNYVGQNRYVIVSPARLPKGRVLVGFNFESEGVPGGAGVGTLYINDKAVAQRRIPKTTPIIYSQYDTFDIGMDSGSPVSNGYESPFASRAKIESVRFNLK